MKSELPFYGVQAAGQRDAFRAAFDRYPLDGFDEWRATVLGLEHAKTDPDWVVAFVQAHADELSALSRREALKHLPSG